MESLVVSGLSAHAWRRGASTSSTPGVSLPVAFCSCRRRYGFKQGSVRMVPLRRDLVIVKAEARADEPEEVPEDSTEKPQAKEARPWGVLRTVGKVFGVLFGGWTLLVIIGLRELERKAIAEPVPTYQEQDPNAVTGNGSVQRTSNEEVREGEDTLEMTEEVAKEVERCRDEVEKRNFGAALDIMNKLVEKHPRIMQFRALRASLYNGLGDMRMALKEYEGMLEVDPVQPQALQGIAMMRAKDGKSIEDIREKVESAFGNALQNKPRLAREYGLLLAQILTLQDKMDAAMRIYEKLCEDDPLDYRPHLSQALMYTMLGRPEQAEVYFQKFDNACPKDLPERPHLEKLIEQAKEQAALQRRRN